MNQTSEDQKMKESSMFNVKFNESTLRHFAFTDHLFDGQSTKVFTIALHCPHGEQQRRFLWNVVIQLEGVNANETSPIR